MNMILHIEGTSRKGKNRINEGLGSQVAVIKETSDKLAIAPLHERSFSSNYVRWIKKEKDPDFKFSVVNSGCI